MSSRFGLGVVKEIHDTRYRFNFKFLIRKKKREGM